MACQRESLWDLNHLIGITIGFIGILFFACEHEIVFEDKPEPIHFTMIKATLGILIILLILKGIVIARSFRRVGCVQRKLQQ